MRDMWEDEIKEWLELCSIEDALEMSDITNERVLEILLKGGHIKLPPFLEREEDNEQEQET